MGTGRQRSEAPRRWVDRLLSRGLSLRHPREPGPSEPPVARGKDLAPRHRRDLQPGRAVWFAAGITGAEQFLGSARGREVALEHGPRELSESGSRPLSPPPPQRDAVAGQVRAPVSIACSG